MSGLWNPHAFGVAGKPVGPEVNTLRVYGDVEPPKELVVLAQQTFAKFCMTERLSFAPNQTQQGFLPDGSKYRIVVVSGTRIMEVTPAETPSILMDSPAIGVTVAGTRWLLRPPGESRNPLSGRWASEKVAEFKGGVGTTFRTSDGNYFVEGSGGTSRGNKRLTDPLFGMTSSIYLYPQTTHLSARVSDPFIFGGSLEQLKLQGGSLGRRARKLSDTGLAGGNTGVVGREDTTYTMPSSSVGDYWGLLTAHSDKKKVVACRIASDVGSWFFEADNIRQSVEMWREKDSSGMSDIVAKLHPPAISIKTPDEAGGAAPKYSSWSRGSQANSAIIYITYANPGAIIPNAPATITTDGIDYTSSHQYTEECNFNATVTFRRYVDFSGEVREDTLTYEDNSDISSTGKRGVYGFDDEGYIDSTVFDNARNIAKTKRTGKLTLHGVRPLTVYEFALDIDSGYDGDSRWDYKFSEYAYNNTGGIKGFKYAGSASAADLSYAKATIQYTIETVLMHDSQFGVAATVRVAAKTTTDAKKGNPRYTVSSEDEANYPNAYDLATGRGDGAFPPGAYIDTDTRTDALVVELIFYSQSAKASVPIAVPPQVHEDLLIAMKALRNEVETLSSRGSADPLINAGVRQNGYRYEEDVKAVLDVVLGYVSAVSYAKDPKTGAGFFSCTWDDGISPEVTRNKVVGPWGWAPAANKTPIANDAKIFSTTSL